MMTAALTIPFEHGLLLSIILFCLGLTGVMLRRNMLFILMSLEIMLNASAMAFVFAGAKWGQPDGQVMFMLILTVAAAEVAVALGLLLQFHRRFQTLDIDSASNLNG